MDMELEKSWKCLHDFDRSHFGRLSYDSEVPVVQSIPLKETDNLQKEEECRQDDDTFPIPELPVGAKVTFKILSTWGDQFYVGLNGLETFASNGLPVKVKRLYAEPQDMTVVPKFVDDPRVLRNLLDGVYLTTDDAHLWLAPFQSGTRCNYISLELEEASQIAMIRIWNYNKSRIHSYRGVRNLEIILDNRTVFQGEISKAPGTITARTEELSDTILFTTDDTILEKLARNDKHLFGESSLLTPTSGQESTSINENAGKRPATGQRKGPKSLHVAQKEEDPLAMVTSTVSLDAGCVVMKGRKFILELCQNWGAQDVIGLTGFQFLDRQGRPCILVSQMLSCNQRKCDPLGRLINDRNITVDASDMWLCKFDRSSPARITVRFPHNISILGLRIWNYNRSYDMSYAGAQILNLYLDDEVILRGVPLVKAPGNLHYNYFQDVMFGTVAPSSPIIGPTGAREEQLGIIGFVFQFQLLSTWGDDFYMGLNGIELFDENKATVKLLKRNLAACPESINCLRGVSNDVRTSDKLIDGVNNTDDVDHMWLTPVLPHTINRIYIIFDKPTTISSATFWNYTKTPSRGVRQVVVLVDDMIVQSCELTISEPEKTAQSSIPLSM